MAFKQFVLIFITIILHFPVSRTNFQTDCDGKAFQCVNSTFFKICVDLGNGISSVVDDYVIECPEDTQCHITNKYECELIKTTTVPSVTVSEKTNEIRPKDERSVNTTNWESIPTIRPLEEPANEYSEKYLETKKPATEQTTVSGQNLDHSKSNQEVDKSAISNTVPVTEPTRTEILEYETTTEVILETTTNFLDYSTSTDEAIRTTTDNFYSENVDIFSTDNPKLGTLDTQVKLENEITTVTTSTMETTENTIDDGSSTLIFRDDYTSTPTGVPAVVIINTIPTEENLDSSTMITAVELETTTEFDITLNSESSDKTTNAYLDQESVKTVSYLIEETTTETPEPSRDGTILEITDMNGFMHDTETTTYSSKNTHDLKELSINDLEILPFSDVIYTEVRDFVTTESPVIVEQNIKSKTMKNLDFATTVDIDSTTTLTTFTGEYELAQETTEKPYVTINQSESNSTASIQISDNNENTTEFNSNTLSLGTEHQTLLIGGVFVTDDNYDTPPDEITVNENVNKPTEVPAYDTFVKAFNLNTDKNTITVNVNSESQNKQDSGVVGTTQTSMSNGSPTTTTDQLESKQTETTAEKNEYIAKIEQTTTKDEIQINIKGNFDMNSGTGDLSKLNKTPIAVKILKPDDLLGNPDNFTEIDQNINISNIEKSSTNSEILNEPNTLGYKQTTLQNNTNNTIIINISTENLPSKTITETDIEIISPRLLPNGNQNTKGENLLLQTKSQDVITTQFVDKHDTEQILIEPVEITTNQPLLTNSDFKEFKTINPLPKNINLVKNQSIPDLIFVDTKSGTSIPAGVLEIDKNMSGIQISQVTDENPIQNITSTDSITKRIADSVEIIANRTLSTSSVATESITTTSKISDTSQATKNRPTTMKNDTSSDTITKQTITDPVTIVDNPYSLTGSNSPDLERKSNLDIFSDVGEPSIKVKKSALPESYENKQLLVNNTSLNVSAVNGRVEIQINGFEPISNTSKIITLKNQQNYNESNIPVPFNQTIYTKYNNTNTIPLVNLTTTGGKNNSTNSINIKVTQKSFLQDGSDQLNTNNTITDIVASGIKLKNSVIETLNNTNSVVDIKIVNIPLVGNNSRSEIKVSSTTEAMNTNVTENKLKNINITAALNTSDSTSSKPIQNNQISYTNTDIHNKNENILESSSFTVPRKIDSEIYANVGELSTKAKKDVTESTINENQKVNNINLNLSSIASNISAEIKLNKLVSKANSSIENKNTSITINQLSSKTITISVPSTQTYIKKYDNVKNNKSANTNNVTRFDEKNNRNATTVTKETLMPQDRPVPLITTEAIPNQTKYEKDSSNIHSQVIVDFPGSIIDVSLNTKINREKENETSYMPDYTVSKKESQTSDKTNISQTLIVSEKLTTLNIKNKSLKSGREQDESKIFVTSPTENTKTVIPKATTQLTITGKNTQPVVIEISTDRIVNNTARQDVKIKPTQYNVTNNINKNNKSLNTHKSTAANSTFCQNKTRGRYSDKNDCRKFFICIGKPEPITGQCPDNTVFSETLKQCTKHLEHCKAKIEFQCMKQGRFVDFFEINDYFICVKNGQHFIRYKFKCQNGYHLNRTIVKCIHDRVKTVKTRSSSIADLSKRDNKSASERSSDSIQESRYIRSKNNEEVRFRCVEEGRFPHPNDCRKYYVCYKSKRSQLRRKRKKCDSDETFHKERKRCVDDESYECSL